MGFREASSDVATAAEQANKEEFQGHVADGSKGLCEVESISEMAAEQANKEEFGMQITGFGLDKGLSEAGSVIATAAEQTNKEEFQGQYADGSRGLCEAESVETAAEQANKGECGMKFTGVRVAEATDFQEELTSRAYDLAGRLKASVSIMACPGRAVKIKPRICPRCL